MLDTITNGHLSSSLAPTLTSVAIAAGLPSSSVPALLEGLAGGDPPSVLLGGGTGGVPGLTQAMLGQVMEASYGVYARGYRLAWSSILPFVVLAIVAVAFLRGVRELMTEHVEATVEHEGLGGREDEDKKVVV